MSAVDFRKLIEMGVHFGHEASRWNPKMKPYIWGAKNNIHLIDVSKTAQCMEVAAEFLKNVVGEGKQVLFVGTKRSAQDIIKRLADKLSMPYVNHRWIGGTLNNGPQVQKSLRKLLHFEDVVARAKEESFYTKKELSVFQKMIARLSRYIGGLRLFAWNDIGAVIVIDVTKEHSAVAEAASTKIPIIGLVDTNSDPSLVDYVIPTNDDSSKALEVVMDYLADAIQAGLAIAAERAKKTAKIQNSSTTEQREARPQKKAVHQKVQQPVEVETAVVPEEPVVEVAVAPEEHEETGETEEKVVAHIVKPVRRKKTVTATQATKGTASRAGKKGSRSGGQSDEKE